MEPWEQKAIIWSFGLELSCSRMNIRSTKEPLSCSTLLPSNLFPCQPSHRVTMSQSHNSTKSLFVTFLGSAWQTIQPKNVQARLKQLSHTRYLRQATSGVFNYVRVTFIWKNLFEKQILRHLVTQAASSLAGLWQLLETALIENTWFLETLVSELVPGNRWTRWLWGPWRCAGSGPGWLRLALSWSSSTEGSGEMCLEVV